MRFFVLFFLVFWASRSSAVVNPGLILHTTQAVVTYGADVAVQVLNKFLNGFTIIPNQSGSFGIGTFTITNLNVRQFNQPPPDTHLVFAPPHGMTFSASGIVAELATDYFISVRVPFIGLYNTSGTFGITAKDVSFSVNADFSTDSSGHVIAHSTACAADGGTLVFHFQPGLDSILNALANVLTPIINFGLNQGLCRALGLIVDTLVNPLLTGIPLTLPLNVNLNSSLGVQPLSFYVDYSFLQSPTIGVVFAEAEFKGQVYASGHQFDAGQPSAPDVVPVSDPIPQPLTNSMVIFQLSDYIVNTFGYAASVSGVTSFTITSDSLTNIGQSAHFLQTCCSDNNCIGGIITSICTTYPHGAVEVVLTSADPPTGQTNSQGTVISSSGYANFNVRLQNGTSALLFKASTQTIEKVTNLQLNHYKITGHITTDSASLNVLQTNVGQLNSGQLQQAWHQGIAGTWDVFLQAIATSGVSLPPLPCFNVQNGHFRTATNNVQVGLDILFVGVNNCPYISHAIKKTHELNKILLASDVK